jgi:hypothetical protein
MLKAMVLRYWPLAVVCVFVIAILAMSRYAEDRKDSNKNNAHQSSPSAPISPDDAGKTGENTDEAENPPSWIDTFAWPEGATVWALFLTLFVIGWQSAETRKAAVATQESARATAEQSENMMARERARLSIIFPPNEPRFYDLLIEDVDGKTYQSMEVFLDIINDGETRAFNVKASGYILIEPIQTGKAYASYGDEFTIPKVVRNATIENPVRIAVCPYGFGTSIQVRSSDCVAIQTGRKPLQVFGTISYEDVFGKPHHTPFLYTWEVRTDNGNWGDEAGWTDHSGASG